jgi:hypothetical protein
MAKSDVLMGVCATVVMVLLISGYQRAAAAIEHSPKAEIESSIVTESGNTRNKEMQSMHSSPDSLASTTDDVCENEWHCRQIPLLFFKMMKFGNSNNYSSANDTQCDYTGKKI